MLSSGAMVNVLNIGAILNLKCIRGYIMSCGGCLTKIDLLGLGHA